MSSTLYPLMCFLQAEVYFVLVFSVYKYFRICQNKRKCSYTSGFFEGVITFSIECMYIWSNSLWHVLWQKWSEITKCITLLWVNGNILPTRNRIFLNSTSLLFFVPIKVFILLYQWLNGYVEKYLFNFARIMIYFSPQQSVIFEHSFYCRIFRMLLLSFYALVIILLEL